ncbi:hypothetical protein Vretifemale_19999 [Volvox reticuliferus]|nr:hypothetical protein Vretifemale_19999 [Volvox reticuliferus]
MLLAAAEAGRRQIQHGRQQQQQRRERRQDRQEMAPQALWRVAAATATATEGATMMMEARVAADLTTTSVPVPECAAHLPQRTEATWRRHVQAGDDAETSSSYGSNTPSGSGSSSNSTGSGDQGNGSVCGDGGGCGANFLGVDVRLALTSRANAWAQIIGVHRQAAFLCANANASLVPLLGSYGKRTTLPLNGPGKTQHAAGGSAAAAPAGPGNGIAARTAAAGGHDGESDGQLRGGGGGRVALVCLQFSDPPVRREQLVGGSELVSQLAETLEPGALVWIQSDVPYIARSFRTLFWRHGGFAPSARHAPTPGAANNRMRHRNTAAAPSGLVRPNSPKPNAQCETLPDDATRDVVVSEAATTAAANAAAEGFPLLLLEADLKTHEEPWLTEAQVAAVVAQQRRNHRLKNDLNGATNGQRHFEGCEAFGEEEEQQRQLETNHQRQQQQQQPGYRGRIEEGEEEEDGERIGLYDSTNEISDDIEGAGGTAGGTGDAPGCAHGSGRDGDGVSSNGCSDGRKYDIGLDDEGEEDGWQCLPWLASNPLGVPTEREVYVERGGRDIYRLLLVRVQR